MRRLALTGLGVLLLAGCASKPAEPLPNLMTPNSRLIYHDQNGHALWTFCDRGNRVYMTHEGTSQVLMGACPNNEP